jgi:isopenicillin-N epimerase
MTGTGSQDFSHLWLLSPEVDFLNHGSFGACPRHVLDLQAQLRAELEREPVRFMLRELEARLDAAREAVAAFVGSAPEHLAFVSCATQGVNTVLRSLRFDPGDELLVTSHEYGASRNALLFAAERSGATVVTAEVPFPLRSPEEVEAAVLQRVTPRTRLALVDHITSQTGLIFPVESLVPKLRERGVLTLVDGAHAPGMVPLALDRLGADFYTANLHKWLCVPKSAGILYVRKELQPQVRPLSISHGASSPRQDRSRFWLEMDWVGTHDPTPYLTAPEAIRHLGSLLPGGWPALLASNHQKVVNGRAALCRALKIDSPAPESMLGSIASVPLPDGDGSSTPQRFVLAMDQLQATLYSDHRIEVPVIPWPAPPKRLLRISAQLYNRPEQYERLASLLPRLLQL